LLIINPKILFWDAGFQLSFAATLGIIYFMPLLNVLTEKLPEDLGLKTLVLTTLSAILATMPLIVYNFGILSLSAPVVNILVVPFVSWTMLFGFLTVLPVVGAGCAMVANWMLIYILKVTAFFGGLPYGSLNLQIGSWVFCLLGLSVIGFYFLLDMLVKRRMSKAVEQNQEL
jgi:competence protein ComEC